MGHPIKEYAPAVLAIIAGVAGFVWSDEATRWIETRGQAESEKPVIGQLQPLGRGVRHRSGASVIWSDVTGNQAAVRADDAIFTNEHTSAKIDLQAHGVLEMQPNSMIVLRGFEPGAKEAPRLVIEKGTIKVQPAAPKTAAAASAPRKPLLVEANRKTFRLEARPGKVVTLAKRPNQELQVAAGSEEVKLVQSDRTGAIVVPSPSPSVTPMPTPTPMPSPTPTPTPLPTATPTPTPTPRPRPRMTPRPTPRPTATPRPTVRPSPTPPPRPTATPTPVPTPTPYIEEDVFIRGIAVPERAKPRPSRAPETPGL